MTADEGELVGGGHDAGDLYIVESLEQARVLVDPLRLKLLRAFAHDPKTTKQVAHELGEKPTRLYRHVDALREVGLLQVREERRKRGTVERYLQAIARRFAVNPSIFEPDEAGDGHDVMRTLFRTTEMEALQAVTRCGTALTGFEPLIAGFGGMATQAQYDDLREQILAWVGRCAEEMANVPGDARPFSGMLALYTTHSPRDEAE